MNAVLGILFVISGKPRMYFLVSVGVRFVVQAATYFPREDAMLWESRGNGHV